MKEVAGIWLPESDEHFSGHLLKEPMLNGKGTYQWKKLIKGVDEVHPDNRKFAVDIGAHVGLWSRVLATMFQRVVAFEPHPDLYPCLARNLMEVDNVEQYEVGLSDKDGYLDMISPPSNSGNARVWNESLRIKGLRRARVYALDNFPLDHKIDFMKIDVEGWELNVLKGAEKTIRRDKPVIVIEQKPGNAEVYGIARFAALELLNSWGFKVVWEKAGDYCVKCT